jgi:hypothetical protein
MLITGTAMSVRENDICDAPLAFLGIVQMPSG